MSATGDVEVSEGVLMTASNPDEGEKLGEHLLDLFNDESLQTGQVDEILNFIHIQATIISKASFDPLSE